MKPNSRFLRQDKDFWAHVRTISQQVGYTERHSKQIKVPSLELAQTALDKLSLSSTRIVNQHTGEQTEFGALLFAYFQYRAEALNTYVEPRLMTLERARSLFTQLKVQLNPSCPLPMNKQKAPKQEGYRLLHRYHKHAD